MNHGSLTEHSLSPHDRKGREGKGSGMEVDLSSTHSNLNRYLVSANHSRRLNLEDQQ